MKLINDIKSPYRLISSVNRHGYKPRGLVFTLKTVLKDPDLHQFVAFRAIDENDPKRVITLDGQRDLVAVPVLCHGSPRVVHVESQQPPKAIATAMARILSETRRADKPEPQKKGSIPMYTTAVRGGTSITTAVRGRKKHSIPYPQPKIPKVPKMNAVARGSSPHHGNNAQGDVKSKLGAKTASSFLNFAKKTGNGPAVAVKSRKPPAKVQKSVMKSVLGDGPFTSPSVVSTLDPSALDMYAGIPYGGYQDLYNPYTYGFKRSEIDVPDVVQGSYVPVEEIGY